MELVLSRDVEDQRLSESIVRKYYELIDDQKIDEVLALFSNSATYVRCETTFSGIEEISGFYKNDRKIKGRHTINSLLAVGRNVVIEGNFVGTGVNGEAKNIRFADFFTLNTEEKIETRHTYLMIGSNYVRE